MSMTSKKSKSKTRRKPASKPSKQFCVRPASLQRVTADVERDVRLLGVSGVSFNAMLRIMAKVVKEAGLTDRVRSMALHGQDDRPITKPYSKRAQGK